MGTARARKIAPSAARGELFAEGDARAPPIRLRRRPRRRTRAPARRRERSGRRRAPSSQCNVATARGRCARAERRGAGFQTDPGRSETCARVARARACAHEPRARFWRDVVFVLRGGPVVDARALLTARWAAAASLRLILLGIRVRERDRRGEAERRGHHPRGFRARLCLAMMPMVLGRPGVVAVRAKVEPALLRRGARRRRGGGRRRYPPEAAMFPSRVRRAARRARERRRGERNRPRLPPHVELLRRRPRAPRRLQTRTRPTSAISSRRSSSAWQPPFTWLFLGPRGARTRLHVDVWHTDAWLTMIEGSGGLDHVPPRARQAHLRRGVQRLRGPARRRTSSSFRTSTAKPSRSSSTCARVRPSTSLADGRTTAWP